MNKREPQFFLTEHERNSALWLKLMSHWEERIATLRRQNDGEIPENTTNSLRGRIAEVKANLSLNKEIALLNTD